MGKAWKNMSKAHMFEVKKGKCDKCLVGCTIISKPIGELSCSLPDISINIIRSGRKEDERCFVRCNIFCTFMYKEQLLLNRHVDLWSLLFDRCVFRHCNKVVWLKVYHGYVVKYHCNTFYPIIIESTLYNIHGSDKYGQGTWVLWSILPDKSQGTSD